MVLLSIQRRGYDHYSIAEMKRYSETNMSKIRHVAFLTPRFSHALLLLYYMIRLDLIFIKDDIIKINLL